jgi:hypothetical protein
MKTCSNYIIGLLVVGVAVGACNGNGGSSAASGGSESTSNDGGSTAKTDSSEGGSNQTSGSTTLSEGGTESAAGSSATGGTSETAGTASGGSEGAGAGGDTEGGSTAAGGKAAGGSNARGGTTAAAGAGGDTEGGSTAAGGAATGGAATGGATATPCSFTTFSNPGNATYTVYDLPNPITACGYKGSNNQINNIVNPGYFAAIPGNTSQDFNTSNRCGACVQIGNAIVTIVDECPNDSNPPCKANPSGHLDLARAAASAAGVQGDPNKYGQNPWKYVPCPINGNVMVRLKQDNEIFIENQILPIASVTCGSQTGSRAFYGAWHFTSNVKGQGCTATDIAGRTVPFTVGTVQDQDVDTGVQFPKCQ